MKKTKPDLTYEEALELKLEADKRYKKIVDKRKAKKKLKNE